MRIVLLAGVAVFLSGCVIGDFGPSDRYQTDFHMSFALQPGGRVNLETMNGLVEITGWDEDKVEIAGTKYASTEAVRDGIRIETHSLPDSIDIRTVKPSSGFGNLGARYSLRVPKNALLDRITTTNGAIRVKGVAAAAHLKSSNGAIQAEDVAGDVDAHTSNGAIELISVHGGATMKTSNGHIKVEDVDGNCKAETSNGGISVRLSRAPVAPVVLTTSNGPVDLRMSRAPRSGIRIDTKNANISLHLPADTAGHIRADTSNSSITSDFNLVAESEHKKNHLDGSIGSGGPGIELSTSNGHIRISKGTAD